MSGREIAVWLVIGLLAGSLAGMLIKRNKGGFGAISNLLFGLVGAFIGGALFKAFDINTGLGDLTIDLDQLVAAFVGALLVVGSVTFLKKRSEDGE
ncbi:MAG: GlsB/YeaQ/YmgE family stress response membrane protein [Planctomycetes bacterium]|nr:GlsB/YeaQ/YmgE family stress response membrane protein [Planctomycetota bacterium]